jgi:polyphenol oxidase
VRGNDLAPCPEQASDNDAGSICLPPMGSRFIHVPAAGRVNGIMVFSLRKGGISPPPFDSLNFSVGEGDSRENIEANRSLLLNDLKIRSNMVVFAHQVHGDNVEVIESAGVAAPVADAMITSVPGVLLGIKTADCLPVLLLDPVRGAAAAIHAGRKGSLSGITGKTLGLMEKEFGTKSADVMAGLGPCIGPCCYEVGDRVTEASDGHASAPDRFVFTKADMEHAKTDRNAFHAFRQIIEIPLSGRVGARPLKGTRPDSESRRLDILSLNVEQLMSQGVPNGNIHIVGLCTACYPDLFFSHRRDSGRTGRHAALVGFHPKDDRDRSCP